MLETFTNMSMRAPVVLEKESFLKDLENYFQAIHAYISDEPEIVSFKKYFQNIS